MSVRPPAQRGQRRMASASRGRLLAWAALAAAWLAVAALTLAMQRESSPRASAQSPTATATPPSVTSIEFEAPLSGDTFGPHELIIARVRFDRLLHITTGGRLHVRLTHPQTGVSQIALFRLQSNSSDYMEFSYAVETTDRDLDGLELAANYVWGFVRLPDPHVDVAIDDLPRSPTVTADARAADASLKVDGSIAAVAPTIKSVKIEPPLDDDKIYKRGEKINVRVQFHRRVAVTGSPSMNLLIGGQSRAMTYRGIEHSAFRAERRSGRLWFEYEVQSGDRTTTGPASVSIGANSLSLSGGATIKADNDSTSNAILTHASAGGGENLRADGGAVGTPKVKRVYWRRAPADGETYILGEQMEFSVEFDRRVSLRCAAAPHNAQCSTVPRLTLAVGSQTRYATPFNMVGTIVHFTYEVQNSDRDADGVSMPANALNLNGGAIKSEADLATDADLTSDAVPARAKGKADGSRVTPPEIERVYFSGFGPYGRGDSVLVVAAFDHQVAVTGTPRIQLTVGTTARYAEYDTTINNNTRMRFKYTVQQGDSDTNGLSIVANALELNGGTIKSFFDSTVDAVITHNAVLTRSAQKVNGGSVTAPRILSTRVLFPGTRTGEDVSLGYRIRIEITFDRRVRIAGALPRMRLTVGTETRYADYDDIRGNLLLRFSYRVQAADRDTDGVGAPANAFDLNGGTVTSDVDGATAATITYGAVSTAINVDGSIQRAPRVANVYLLDQQSLGAGSFFPIPASLYPGPATGNTLGLGERFVAAVEFEAPVTVTGSPRLKLTVGSTERLADLFIVVWDTLLYFNYVVQASDRDTDGISTPANPVDLNGGTIRLLGATTGADLAFEAKPDSAHGYLRTIDVNGSTAVAPTVEEVGFLMEPEDGAYRLGDTITARVRFSRAVETTGTPQLALTVGNTTRQASFAPASRVAFDGRTFPSSPAGAFGWMLFGYTVAAGDLDLDGIALAANAVGLNSGTIALKGAATTAAALTHDAVTADAKHPADGLTWIRADDDGPPVVGEPLVAGASDQAFRAEPSPAATSIACDAVSASASHEPWVWQRSDDGETGWSDVSASRASDCTYVYVPASGDAGKHFRARIPLTSAAATAAGAPSGDRYATTGVTDAAVASSAAATGTGLFGSGHSPPRVEQAIEAWVAHGGAPYRPNAGWRWRRCDDAAMTSNCVLLQDADGVSYRYTPVAADQGKYLEAWLYFSLVLGGGDWQRWETAAIGPVQAAAASP